MTGSQATLAAQTAMCGGSSFASLTTKRRVTCGCPVRPRADDRVGYEGPISDMGSRPRHRPGCGADGELLRPAG